MKLKILFVVLAFLFVGCTEVSQIINPSPVTISGIHGTPALDPAMPAPTPGASGTITLDPPNITLDIGQFVNVVVTVRVDGQKVRPENVSVSIFDKSILRFVEVDIAPDGDKAIAFEGLASGVTSVIVTASGLQTSLVATVAPIAQSSVAILS